MQQSSLENAGDRAIELPHRAPEAALPTSQAVEAAGLSSLKKSPKHSCPKLKGPVHPLPDTSEESMMESSVLILLTTTLEVRYYYCFIL